jgi:gamma-glutamyltranspeptidase/glutathione hydrolase
MVRDGSLQMLNIIEGYDFSDIPFGSAKHYTLSTKLKKISFEDRLSTLI